MNKETQVKPRLFGRWSAEKLDKEIAFAEAALDHNDIATIEWLNQLYYERQARFGG